MLIEHWRRLTNFDASIHWIRLAQCFTDAKEQYLYQKTSKNSVKMGKLFKSNLTC